MSTQTVNPDLQKERQTATFNVESLTNLLDGGKNVTNRRREIIQKALKEKVFTEGPPSCFLSRNELYESSVRKTIHVKKIMDEWKLTPQEREWLLMVAFPMAAPPDDLHEGMFRNAMENQATDAQKEKWLPKINSRQIMGTYSQTELGHGTHVRSLETTATFDPQTDEFVIHSPTLTAMKWWPGAQGKTSNSGVVMAQLYSQGIHHGLHAFFVVFRDLNTHQPLPGITVGDIGPKLGFNTTDNGFLRFDHFRIPRENMLMKNSEVRRDGTYVTKTKLKKPMYITMTLVRNAMVKGFGYTALGAGMTIAIRYSAVRRQSELQPGAPEPQIMDYQTQQHKLFPYLAMTYAYKFASDRLGILVEGIMAERNHGRDDLRMPELHALSSGLKASSSYALMLGLEQGRMSCGGHGYSEASGFPKLFTFNAPSTTFEGENSVLLLQQARYLMKCVQGVQRGEALAPSVAFLSQKKTGTSSINSSFSLESFKEAFEHRAYRVIHDAALALQKEMASGRKEYDARNRCAVFLVRAALAHSQTYVVTSFVEAIKSIQDAAIANVMTHLCQLFAAYHITNQSGDFLEDGYMTPDQLKIVRAKEISLLADIRPNAIALVDAFDYPDIYLGSVLGRYDGQVYENLYKWAQASPLNKTQVHESYYKYLQPMMKAKM